MYNGWTRYTADPALKYSGLQSSMPKIPCELMKYDWNPHINNNFCINTQTCSLNKATKTDEKKHMCFSFYKGSRTFIYVRTNYMNNQSDKTASKTPEYVSYNSKQNTPKPKSSKQTKPQQKTVKAVKPAKATPKAVKPKNLKDCPPGKIRNPDTNRCIKVCPPGYVILPRNNVLK